MTIARVKPAGWAFGEELTQDQLNQLDKNLGTLATDKTGDSITGNISLAGEIDVVGTAMLHGFIGNASGTWLWGGDGNAVLFAGGVQAVVSGGGQAVIGDGGVLKTFANARIQHADSDWMEFSARDLPRVLDLATARVVYGSGWSQEFGMEAGRGGAVGPGTSNPATIPLLPEWLHNGSTLTKVELLFTPSTTTTTGDPANFPQLAITQRTIAAGATVPARANIATTTFVNSGSAYRSGVVKVATLTLSHVIDTSTKQYALKITDENGLKAIAGAIYHAARFTFSVTDLRFQ